MKEKQQYFGAEFLNEDYEICEPREGTVKDVIQDISKHTFYKCIDPSKIEIYSITRRRKAHEPFFEAIKIKPDYMNLKFLMPRKLEEVYFQEGKGNKGTASIVFMLKSGITKQQLAEIEDVGFFMQYKDAGETLTLLPSRAFLATLCKQLGIGKLNPGIDQFRDMYIGSKLANAEPFCIVYRTWNDYAKVFACFSERTMQVSQNIFMDYYELLNDILGTTIKGWKYNHFRTEVDFAFPMLWKPIKADKMYRFMPGVRLSFSDVGDAAFKLQPCIHFHGGVILLDEEVSMKRCKKLNVSYMVNLFYEKCYPLYEKTYKNLVDSMNVEIKDKAAWIKKALHNSGFYSNIGIGLKNKFIAKFDALETKEGDTVFHALVEIMKIPGATDCPAYVAENISVAVGKIFKLNLRKGKL